MPSEEAAGEFVNHIVLDDPLAFKVKGTSFIYTKSSPTIAESGICLYLNTTNDAIPTPNTIRAYDGSAPFQALPILKWAIQIAKRHFIERQEFLQKKSRNYFRDSNLSINNKLHMRI